MSQGLLEARGPLWGWGGDGDDDWDSSVLALLALAVVAATALALHWFGSGQDQEVAELESTAPGTRPAKGEARLAPHPECKVGGGSEGERRGPEKPHRPRPSQGSPATSAGLDAEPLAGGLAATAERPRTPGAAGCRGALGRRRGASLSGTPQGGAREPRRPDAAPLGRSKAGATPAPLLIHFALRGPGDEAELQAGAGAGAEGPARWAPVRTEKPDTSAWHAGAGPPGLPGTDRGSRRERTGAVSRDRSCRPPKLDPLRLGAATSVWDAVDFASAAALAARARSPGATPPAAAQSLASPTGPGPRCSERGLEKSGPQPAPVLTLGSGAEAGERETGASAPREALGIPAPEQGKPWARWEVLGTGGLTPPEAQVEFCGLDWKRGDHGAGEGSACRPGHGGAQAAGSPAASQEPPLTLHRGRPRAGGSSCSPSTSGQVTPPPRSTGLGPGSPKAARSGAGLLAAPTPSPSNPLPHGVSQGPSEGENISSAPTSLAAPIQVSTSTPAVILSLSPSQSPFTAPSPASASPLTSAPPTVLVPVSTPASISSPSPTSPPTPVPAPALTPGSVPAPVSRSKSASGDPEVGLSRSYQEGQISSSWGNLIAMVLRSHPFPRQEKPLGSAPVNPAGPSTSTHSEDRLGASHSAGVVLSFQDKHSSSLGMVTQSVDLDKAPCQPQPRSFETNGAPTSGPPPGPRGDGTKEKSLDLLPPTAMPGTPSQPSVQMQPGSAPSSAMRWDSQHVPRPRKHSICEIVLSSEQLISQVVPEQHQGQVLRKGVSTAGSRKVLTEKKKEDQKLMLFLQRPGSWGMVEGPQKPAARVPCPQQLDLGSCLEVLAFAQQYGKPGLAQETYTLMSNNLLHVLGDPHLYRQLSGAERERILRLRTGQGQAVLGVLVLPSLYQLCHSGLKKSSHGEEAPAAQPEPLPHRTQLHVFNPQENIWRPLTQVPEEAPLRGCGLCTMHNYLFLAGGIRGSGAKAVCSNEVFCYNPLTNIWSQVRPMQQARAQLKLVALDGLLYAIGGECLYSMERYDPRTDAWTLRAPLPAGTFPVAHEAVACRGDIYVTGGHLFYRLLRYSPVKDSWDECPYSASHRRSSDMVALGGFLYRFDLLRGVGAAVMRYNTVTGSWSRAASLPLPDPVPLRCTVLGNTIYCLNHQVTATFTVSKGTAQFQAKELQPFPLGNKGILCPFILTLPPEPPLQTSL